MRYIVALLLILGVVNDCGAWWPLENNKETTIYGDAFSLQTFQITVPEASEHLVVQLQGDDADADLLIWEPNVLAQYNEATCAPLKIDSNEVCSFGKNLNNPNSSMISGVYRIIVRRHESIAPVKLTAYYGKGIARVGGEFVNNYIERPFRIAKNFLAHSSKVVTINMPENADNLRFYSDESDLHIIAKAGKSPLENNNDCLSFSLNELGSIPDECFVGAGEKGNYKVKVFNKSNFDYKDEFVYANYSINEKAIGNKRLYNSRVVAFDTKDVGSNLHYAFSLKGNVERYPIRFNTKVKEGDFKAYVKYNGHASANNYDCVMDSSELVSTCQPEVASDGLYHITIVAENGAAMGLLWIEHSLEIRDTSPGEDDCFNNPLKCGGKSNSIM